MTAKTRMTRQRRIILEELQGTDTHPTAEEVYERVRRRLPRISLATVYRNLEHMYEAGDALKLEVGGGSRRFDGNVTDFHYHARCNACGRVVDVPDSAVTSIEYSVEGIQGFWVTGHELVFTGLCPHCQAAQTGPDGQTR